MEKARQVEHGADEAFDGLVRSALCDPAARCRLPGDFASRVIHAARRGDRDSGQYRLPRWAKVAASVVALASATGFAAWVGMTHLAGRLSSASGDDLGGPTSVSATDGTACVPPANDIFDTNQGGNMIMARKVASLVGAAVLTVTAPAQKLMSESTFIFLKPETSSFWNTATNSTMTLPIDYPAGASSATLAVEGDGYAYTYMNITGTSFDLQLPAPDAPEQENVYNLTLTFDNGVVRTAKLGLIQGLAPQGAGSTRCLAPANGTVWNTMRKRAVLPIPYGTTAFTVTVNGQQRVNETELDGAQGWYALGGINRKDEVVLSFTTNGISCLANLLGKGNGYFVLNFK